MNTIFDPTDLVFVNPIIQMADGGARINFYGKWKVVPVNNGLTFVKVEKQANTPALVDEDDDDSYPRTRYQWVGGADGDLFQVEEESPRRDDCCESGQGSGDDSY